MITCMAVRGSLARLAQGGVLALALLLPTYCRGGQFIEIKAELELDDWDGAFFFDKLGHWPGYDHPPSLFTTNLTRRCVVGAKAWMLESASANANVTYWFTGTNIIEHSVVTRRPPHELVKQMNEVGPLAVTAPAIGQQSTRAHESLDGNPGRPVRVADVMGFDLPAKVCWLAFCSGPCLKHEGQRIYPPSDFWKESALVYWGWSDHTEVFQDTLGLPKSINLVSTNNQSIFQYQVHLSTNVLGWNIPLEFYGVQYLPTGTNAWKVALTFKGKVTAISPAAEPRIPPGAMDNVGQ